MSCFRKSQLSILLAIVSFIVSILYLCYIPQQNEFLKIIIPYSVAFLSYYWIIKNIKGIEFKLLISLAIVIRISLIMATPNLSDDIYRFIWDGRLLQEGISPYGVLPTDVKEQYNLLSEALYLKLNSPNYYTIYPTVTQLFNYISTIPKSITLGSEIIIYKLLIVFCEIALLRALYLLLKVNDLSPNRLFLYALNPLIIIEISNNLHFEGVMILFLIASLLFIDKNNRLVKTAVLFALSVASKLLPLMFLPLLLMKKLKQGQFRLLIFISTLILLLLLPILLFNNLSGEGQLASLDLYLKKFEFNGSIYYALRSVGYMIYGYNLIHVLGPILTIGALIAIMIISYKDKSTNLVGLSTTLLFITTIFLITSRTVHPWYLSLAIVFCLFNQYRFPIVWSYLIGWTYINYSYPVYHEQLWVVAIEYSIVFFMIYYEYSRHKKRPIAMQ